MMPRRFWILTGWVITLATLATAAAVVEDTFRDVYELAGCAPPAAAPDYAACADSRMWGGAAEVAGAIFKVPAIGLALVAAAIGFGARRKEAGHGRMEGVDGVKAAEGVANVKGVDGAEGIERVERVRGGARRSKAPSKALIPDVPAS